MLPELQNPKGETNADPDLTLHTEINFTWITDLNVKAQPISFQKKMQDYLHNNEAKSS